MIKISRQTALAFAVIVVFFIPVLFIQTEMFDGVWIRYAVERHDFSGFKTVQYAMTWYLTYWLYWLIAEISYATNIYYLWIVKVALITTYLGLYVQYKGILIDTFKFNSDYSHAIALLACLFPSIQIYASSLGLAVPVYLFFGLIGYRWVQSEKPWQIVFGIIFVLIGFQLNSVMTFLVGLTICKALLEWSDRKFLSKKSILTGLGVLFLAVLYLLARKVFFPPIGHVASYNVLLPFSLDGIKSMARAMAMFLTWFLIPVVVSLFVLLLMLFSRRLQVNLSLTSMTKRQYFLVASMVTLWLGAVGPYVMVGKGPPLLTITSIGQGITEQAIRGMFDGWLIAPTFSVTSGRHGILCVFVIAMCTWICADFLRVRCSKKERLFSSAALLVLCLPIMFILPWGGAWNRLKQQHVEISITNGLRSLAAAPAGVVEIKYSPVSDWLVHLGPGNQITHNAWGEWTHMSFVYSFDNYLRELHWAYNSGFKQLGGLKKPWLQATMPVTNFVGERCISRYTAIVPAGSFLQVLLAGAAPQHVAPSLVRLTETQCQDGQTIINPMPDRPATY